MIGAKMKVYCYECGKIIETNDEDITLHTGSSSIFTCTINLCKRCFEIYLKSNEEKDGGQLMKEDFIWIEKHRR